MKNKKIWQIVTTFYYNLHIAGLQPIPRDSNDRDAAAMLGVQTIEAN